MDHEVTQAEWNAAFKWNRSAFTACGDTCPEDTVSWYDVAAYANAKSAAAGLTPCYVFTDVICQDDFPVTTPADCINMGKWVSAATVTLHGVATPYLCAGYRLPTEAEWEYAYRAGSSTAFYPSAGNDGAITQTESSPLDPNLDQIGWYFGNSAVGYTGCCDASSWGGPSCIGTHPGGGKAANAWGVYDMPGNLSEWCADGWHADWGNGAQTDPYFAGTAAYDRSVRGGAWCGDASFGRAAWRGSYDPSRSNSCFGARLARSVP